MRYFILIIITLCSFTTSIAQTHFQYAFYKDGFWGDWRHDYDVNAMGIVDLYGYDVIRGTYDDFVLCIKGIHPSTYRMRVTITGGFTLETNKKARKKRVKNNLWYEYSGKVEIFTDAESFIDRYPRVPMSPKPEIKNNVIDATIRIAPYLDAPTCYNVFFDGVGMGFIMMEPNKFGHR